MGFEKFSKKELISLVETLLAKVNVLEKQVETLNIKVAQLQEENQILRINKNSSNSSKAPSSDTFKANQSLRVKSELKKGGQPGHKGFTLEMTACPDEIIYHDASFCKNCGANIEHLSAVTAERRQVIDLPVVIPVCTEHQSLTKICSCGCICKGDFPKNVRASIQYGSGVESLVAYFSVRQFMPFKRMKECFSDVFGLNICQSSLSNSISRFAQKGKFVYNRIKENIKNSEVIGSDETGATLNGTKAWFWVWQNPKNTLISFNKRRGYQAVTDTFSEHFKPKTIVSDCWAAQLKVNADNHQICTAHLTRELNYFIETTKDDWAEKFKQLLLDAIKLKNETIDYKNHNAARQLLELRLNKLLEFGEFSKHKKQKAFQKRLLKHKNKIFQFLYSSNIPPDNNASERAIRNIKVKQKNSGQFVSHQKAIDFAIIRSTIDTILKNGKNIIDTFRIISQISAE